METEARRMTARYPGRCTECGQAIAVGDEILYGGRGRTAHVQCPVRLPSAVLACRDHGEPTMGPAGRYDAGEPCRACREALTEGEACVTVSVRRRGRASDDLWRYHAACWDAATAPAARPAAEPRTAPAAAPTSPAAQDRRPARGSDICRRCHGPVADGSGYCSEC